MGAELGAGGIPFDDACLGVNYHPFGGVIEAPDEGVVIAIFPSELITVGFVEVGGKCGGGGDFGTVVDNITCTDNI